MKTIMENKHGGKRPGAGRKKSAPELLKIPISIKLPRWVIEWMRMQKKSQAVLIEDALMQRHGITPPEHVIPGSKGK